MKFSITIEVPAYLEWPSATKEHLAALRPEGKAEWMESLLEAQTLGGMYYVTEVDVDHPTIPGSGMLMYCVVGSADGPMQYAEERSRLLPYLFSEYGDAVAAVAELIKRDSEEASS